MRIPAAITARSYLSLSHFLVRLSNATFHLDIALAIVIGVALFSASLSQAAEQSLIGISLPTKTSLRWIADGSNMVKVLKEKGYATDLKYAEDDVPTQLNQIAAMINKGAKVLVITAIDGGSLNQVLQKAAEKNIKVIAYDRLIRNTPYVDCYATFDNYQVGVLQATSIEKALGLKTGKGPFNIELFAGSADDNNALFFYDGAMSVFKPYVDRGKLIVRSKQTDFKKVATLRWDPMVAQARMDKLITSYYVSEHINAVLAPYDGISISTIAALKLNGYGQGSLKMPFVSGQDTEIASVKSILRGEQYSTVFKDTRELAKVAGNMVEALLKDTKPEINDVKTYNNGIKVVPAFLLKPVVIDATNAKAILVGGGYYTEAQIK